jgi:hypothetical protein
VMLFVGISLNFVDIETHVQIWSVVKRNRNNHPHLQNAAHVTLRDNEINRGFKRLQAISY